VFMGVSVAERPTCCFGGHAPNDSAARFLRRFGNASEMRRAAPQHARAAVQMTPTPEVKSDAGRKDMKIALRLHDSFVSRDLFVLVVGAS